MTMRDLIFIRRVIAWEEFCVFTRNEQMMSKILPGTCCFSIPTIKKEVIGKIVLTGDFGLCPYPDPGLVHCKADSDPESQIKADPCGP
jgi:hypothetical protein